MAGLQSRHAPRNHLPRHRRPPSASRRRRGRPRRLGLGRRTHGLEPRRRPAAPPLSCSPSRRRRRRHARLRPRARPARRPAGHRATAPLRCPTSTTRSCCAPSRMRGVEIDAGARPPASRPARCGTTSSARGRARPGRAARLLAATSASPATRSAAASAGSARKLRLRLQQRARLRRRHRRRPARARVDADSEPDLFWALRGGGGASAVVTAVEFGLVELRELYAGQLVWPLERAPEVLAAYREWTAGVPDEVSASLKLMRFPPSPTFPSPSAGASSSSSARRCWPTSRPRPSWSSPARRGGDRHGHHADDPCQRAADARRRPADPVPGIGDGLSSPSSRRRARRRCSHSPDPAWPRRCCRSSCASSAGCSPRARRPRRRQQHRRRLCALRHRDADLARGGRGAHGGAARAKGGLVLVAQPRTPLTLAEADPSLRSSFADADVQRLANVKDAPSTPTG